MKRPVSGAIEAKCLREWLERNISAVARITRLSSDELIQDRRESPVTWSELKRKAEK
jgi:hypothetical protein